MTICLKHKPDSSVYKSLNNGCVSWSHGQSHHICQSLPVAGHCKSVSSHTDSKGHSWDTFLFPSDKLWHFPKTEIRERKLAIDDENAAKKK